MLGLCHVWNVVGVERFWLMGSRRGVGSAMRMGWFVAQLVINEVFDFFYKKKTRWMWYFSVNLMRIRTYIFY